MRGIIEIGILFREPYFINICFWYQQYHIYISKTCWLWSLTAPNFHWSPWIPLGPASNQWKAFSHGPLGPPKSTIYFGLLDAPLKVLKVLKPTVSRESFWNHSIKKWPDIASPFILDNNIKGFIAFWMFLVQKWLPNEHKKFRNPRPPPYLGIFPKFYQFFWRFP